MTGGLTISRSACKTFRVSGSATPPAGESSAGCARYTATRSPKAGAAKGGPRGGAYVTALGDEAPGEIATAFIVGRGTQVPCLSRISGGVTAAGRSGGRARATALLLVVAALTIPLAGCLGGASRDGGLPPGDHASSSPGRGATAFGGPLTTMMTGEANGGVLGPSNDRPVPGVVGRRIGAACRALGRHGYAGEIFGVRAAGERPGRVVEQDPGPGYRGGEGQLVHLVVTAPFRGALTRASSCVDRTDDSGAASSPPGSRPPRVCYGYFWFRPTASPLPRVTSEA